MEEKCITKYPNEQSSLKQDLLLYQINYVSTQAE